MWQVSYVWKGETFEEVVIIDESHSGWLRAENIKFFLAKSKSLKYTNIRWRKL